MKARVLITAGKYRVVATAYQVWLERRDGHDRIGVQRWRDADASSTTEAIGAEFVRELGRTMLQRARRRRRERER